MSEAKRQSLQQARHWQKLRNAIKVSHALKAAGREHRERLLQEEKKPADNFGVTIERLKESPIQTLLLVAVPLGVVSSKAKWPAWMTFWFNFIALIPLSGYLGQATEDLSSYTSEVTAGLLNATFGNVVEMMVAVMAMLHGDVLVVQSTCLGSVLSNLLFVLGSCFMYGGFKTHELNFSSKASSTCTSLLLLASIALALPTVMSWVVDFSGHDKSDIVLPVSRYSSIIIFFIYLQFLYFQLVSHKDYFGAEEEDDDDEDKWGPVFATAILAISSVLTAFTCDYLVASIHGYSDEMNLNKAFIGLILVASIGNIPEFYVTLMVARNNKLDLALTIAVGSSCQMALFVTPFAVLTGWMMDVPMSLDFHGLQIICLVLAVLTVSSVIQDGSATWLHGSLLVGSYVIIAMMFFFLPSEATVS